MVEHVDAGRLYTCAKLSNQTVKCWGTMPSNEVYNSPQDIQNLSGVQDLQVDSSFACALIDTGEVACWGRNNRGQLGDGMGNDSIGSATRVAGISNAIAIHVGPDRACALLDTAQIKCWGSNDYGVLGDGTTQDKPTPFVLSL